MESQTREIFWSIGPAAQTLFYALAFIACATFAWGVLRHVIKYGRGRRLGRPVDLFGGIKRMLGDLATHRTLKRRDRLAGLAHQGIFLGYLIATIGTIIIFVDYDITRPLLGRQVWKGLYYLLTSFVLDIGHLALLLGVLTMIVRRAAFHLSKLDYIRRYRGETSPREPAKSWKVEDWVFLLALLALELTGFVQEGARLLVDRPPQWDWSPIGAAVAYAFQAAGMEANTANGIRAANWWLHGGFGLLFTAAIPWYKAKHIVAVVGSLSLRDRLALRRLEKDVAEEGRSRVGIADVGDLTWREMLQLDACTKCGRCHEACPARAAGLPLSPRDLILDLRLANDERRGIDVIERPIVGATIEMETLWSCMSCGACLEICPVGIEHPPLIVKMRRQLVDRDMMEPQLRATFAAIADTGNSFGEAPRRRPNWTDGLDFKVKDIRNEPAEILWFVGDYASFDPRNQNVSRTVAKLLRVAGVDFAILHEAEWTAGNDVRRAGEEGLYESLAEHNLGAMAGARHFKRIMTTDPHSYNTIRNEYPEFGAVAPIDHYSTVLADLLAEGRLPVTAPLNKRVTFHDPCHLGRLNGGYDAPRQVLKAIGCDLIEMPRNRDNSFCCGAGGGRIWIPDPPGIEKPSISRMHEAAALDRIDFFVTCCPKDLTMYEDARKTSGHERDFVVQDLAELVTLAVSSNVITSKDLPALSERIVDAIAARIGDVVGARIDEALTRHYAGATPTADRLSSAATSDQISKSNAETEPTSQIVSTQALDQDSAEEKGSIPAQSLERTTEITQRTLRAMDWARLAPVAPAQIPPHDVPAKNGPRILVAVKHVAILGDERLFAADHRDVRPETLEHGLNEWDDAALEEALRIVERLGTGEVVAMTIGDEGAETSLRKALAKGAHRAVRLWHPDLVGADPISIARGLAGIAALEKPDLLLCGVQSSDQANGATGVALARILGLPHAAVVVDLDWDGASRLQLTRELDGGLRHRFNIQGPAVVAVQTGINVPRYATMRMIKDAKKKTLAVVDGSTVMNGDGGYVVRRVYTPELTKAQMVRGSPEEAAAFVARIIRERKGK